MSLTDPDRYLRDVSVSVPPGPAPWTHSKTWIVILCVLPIAAYLMATVGILATREDLRAGCDREHLRTSAAWASCVDAAAQWPD